MIKRPFVTLTIIFCRIFFPACLMAQMTNNDSSLTAAQIKNAVDLYDAYTGPNLPIYNGGAYMPYNFKSVGNPFFDTDSLTAGNIGYDGKVYNDIPMMYDIVRNQVVILNYNRASFVVLHNDKVDSFELAAHHFIRMVKDSVSGNTLSTGFYDLLYNGNVKLYARRSKEFQSSISGNSLIRTFYQHNNYYLLKNGNYFPVDNKKEVFDLFRDKLHLVKRYARRHHLKFRKKFFENTLAGITAYYDQLTRK